MSTSSTALRSHLPSDEGELLATIRHRLVVRGRVQGVFFRDSCQREATRLHVAGWARNLNDGSVEVVAEGESDAVSALEQWCHHGPPRALVAGVDGRDEPPEGVTGFRAR